MQDYYKNLEEVNFEFKINRIAYALYYDSLSSDECNMGFNHFCDSEFYKEFRQKALREYKLERICK